MEISLKGKAELLAYESIALSPYIDSGGVKTVGGGSTISDIPDLPSWPWTKTISLEDVIVYFERGLKKYVAALNRAITRLDIPQHQFDALVSITYNIGIGAMQKSTFLKLVNQNAPASQIVAAMGRFKYDNGKVVQGLINRRAKEADLFLNGNYASKGMVNIVPVNGNHKPVYKAGKHVNILQYLSVEEQKKELSKEEITLTTPTEFDIMIKELKEFAQAFWNVII